MSETQSDILAAGEQAGSRYAFAPPRRAPRGVAGLQLGSRTGSSIEFKDHREYQPGDDPRRIDWNAYARSDRLIMKLYQEEVSPHLDLILDGSRSMALEGTSKLEATLGLAAALVTAALNAGFSHSAWLAGETCAKIEGSSGRPVTWPPIRFDYTGGVLDSFARTRAAWRPHGVRVLISDLFWMGDPSLVLQQLCRDASAAVVIQALAATDAEPTERGNMRLVDSETGHVREIVIDAIAVKRYRANLALHQENWRLACRQTGATMVTLLAEEVAREWALDDLVAAGVLRVA